MSVRERINAPAARVTYQITAVRSTRAGHPAQFTINFGVEGEEKRGGLTITDEAA